LKDGNYPAYIFCLALSYCKWKNRKGAPENPWLLFEELARFTAKNYLGGDAIIFGTSCRQKKPVSNGLLPTLRTWPKNWARAKDSKNNPSFPPRTANLIWWHGKVFQMADPAKSFYSDNARQGIIGRIN